MARSVTGSFWLTEALQQSAGGLVQGTIDLGAYVDVGAQQGIAIEEVDFIWQRLDTATGYYDSALNAAMTGNASFNGQLTDLNPGNAVVRADNNTLVASGVLFLDDANNVATMGPDVYPDTYGKLDEARMVVNDQLYFTSDIAGTVAANNEIVCVARIKARIVKLSTKDWMSIAIQSTAADN